MKFMEIMRILESTGIVLLFMTLIICIESYDIKESSNGGDNVTKRREFEGKVTSTPMHKAVLTQRGYIQFLRWKLPVPEITQFTFCEWVKSTNLTYQHSIFSYSKNEKDRVVRAWISPYGRSIHLEINNIELFAEPVLILENQWYHICQSWDNREGRYGLWLDGRLQVDGTFPDMADYVIESGGDIVVGQELTDFDKGLEEGVEGAVLGFNLLLASAFEPMGFVDGNALDDGPLTAPINFPEFSSSGRLTSAHSNYPPWAIHARRGRKRGSRQAERSVSGIGLIEATYYRCAEARGSPFIGGGDLLISWTRTPVKVFGGALLKNVDGECGIFNEL